MKQREINVQDIVLRKAGVDKKIDYDTIVTTDNDVTITEQTITTLKPTNTQIQTGGYVRASAADYTPIYPIATQQALTGDTQDVVINLTSYITTITTGNFTVVTGETSTLAAGSFQGQMKELYMIVDGGDDQVVTFNTTETLTFSNAGEYALLIYEGTAWIAIVLSDKTAAGNAPVLA